ncbi:MAG: hypothetical protein ACYC9L_03055 [Sulfuricaulis sp.]
MKQKARAAVKRKLVGVRIPDDLHDALRHIALKSNIPLQDVIETVLRHYVKVDATAFHVRSSTGSKK